MAVRLPSEPDFMRRRQPKRDAVSSAPPRVIRGVPPMPPRPPREDRARNTIPEPLVELTCELILAQGFAKPRYVADFQQAKGLKIDGVIGPKTMMAALESSDKASPPVAKLRSYDPSWRDRVASALIQWGLPEDTVEGLMGSRGLGPTEKNFGIGFVDLTPAGIPLAVDEAKRAWEAGNSTDAALNIAGVVPIPGAKVVAKAAKKGAGELESLAARVDMLDPPPQPLRPFEADYPGKVPADETGKLYRDRDGHIIRAPIVVGRQMTGGPDVPLSREEYASIIKAITGRDIRRAPTSELEVRGEPSGGATYFDTTNRRPVEVVILDSLAEDEYWTTVRHEFGHVIDLAADTIQTVGLEDELRRIYGALQRVPEDPSFPITPENLQYERGEVTRRELIAEAIRAYAMDPNYIKAVAPETAKAIRRWVRASPQLSKTLHFNSIAAGLVAGVAAKGALPEGAEVGER